MGALSEKDVVENEGGKKDVEEERGRRRTVVQDGNTTREERSALTHTPRRPEGPSRGQSGWR